MKPEIKQYKDLEELSLEAAGLIVQWAKTCVRERGIFTWVLSGGKTPRRLYQLLGAPPLSKRMPWNNTHLFWGDERCVPADHAESNFHTAYEALISKIPLRTDHVHRIPAERSSPDAAAIAYEEHLKGFFESQHEGKQKSHLLEDDRPFPAFDLILLGVGKDGHTASLFPGDRALKEKVRWVSAVFLPKGSPPVPRVTLTLPVINRGQHVLVLTSGAGKGQVIRTILEDPEAAAELYPAARVRPEGRLIWFIDDGTRQCTDV